jgi:hypothetical protein
MGAAAGESGRACVTLLLRKSWRWRDELWIVLDLAEKKKGRSLIFLFSD